MFSAKQEELIRRVTSRLNIPLWEFFAGKMRKIVTARDWSIARDIKPAVNTRRDCFLCGEPTSNSEGAGCNAAAVIQRGTVPALPVQELCEKYEKKHNEYMARKEALNGKASTEIRRFGGQEEAQV